MQLSIVVPVRNEADNLLPLIHEIADAMRSAESYEIVYVDDGSDDHSDVVFKQALQEIPALKVIRHARSYGQSAAIHTGVKTAKFPWIATLDGDGQNDPQDIPRLFEVLMGQRQPPPAFSMVAGWRNKRHDTAWRLFSSKVANAVRSSLLGDNTPDTGCGLKVFSKNLFLALPYFDHMHRFLPALVLRAGGSVVSEPVNHRPRNAGSSKYGTLDRLGVGIVDLLGVMWLQKRATIIEAKEIEH